MSSPLSFPLNSAKAVTLVPHVITDTNTNLVVDWRGKDLDNGLYDHIFQIPALVNWVINAATITYPTGKGGGEPWNITVEAQHISQPHPGSDGGGPGNIATLTLFPFDYTNYPSNGVIALSEKHGDHSDRYTLGYIYKFNSDLDITLTGVHQVPSPLPLAGAISAFGFSRKLRNRIKNAQSKVC